MTIKTLLIDIGGVILTNGWDTAGRKLAAKTFSLDYEEFEKRHRLTFDTYEIGKMSLKDYLEWTVFYEKRSFSYDDFEEFIFDYSEPYENMIELFTQLKEKYHLRIGTISNEGIELTFNRVESFNLNSFIDFFIVSGFVHLKKPDTAIYQMALDLAQTPKNKVLYIDDRELLIQVARKLEIPSLHHVTYEQTKKELENFGLAL
jgi:putative hydrolase of the HAD superfamily